MRIFFLLLTVRLQQSWRRSASRSKSLIVSGVLIALFVIPLSILMALFARMALLGGEVSSESVGEAVTLGFAASYMYSLFSPFFGMHASDYLDLEKTRIYPLSAYLLYAAALAGSLLSGGLLFLLPTILVALAAVSHSVFAFFFNLIVLVFFLLHTAMLRQGVTLACLNLLKGRRYQDVLRVFIPVIGILVFGAFQFLAYRQPSEVSNLFASIDIPDWVHWTPPFWHAGLIVSTESHKALVLFQASMAVSSTIALFLAGVALLRRALVGENESVPIPANSSLGWRKTPAKASGSGSWLPGPLRGMIAKELLVVRREPSIKTLLIQQSFLFLLPLAMLVARTGLDFEEVAAKGGDIILPSLLILLYVEFQVFYFSLGFEGKAIVNLLSSPIDPGWIFIGKNLVFGVLALFWNTFIVLLFSLLFNRPEAAVPYVFLGASILFITLGWANLSTVLFPLPISSTGRSPLSQAGSDRRGCLLALWSYLNLALLLLLGAPPFAIFHFSVIPEAQPIRAKFLGILFALCYGILLYALFLFLSIAVFKRRQTRILELFTRQEAS
jgi:hypothetical protein